VTSKTWLGAVLFFFGWGFVMHGAGLVLHEVGGHGVAGATLGCGVAGIDLTYFGHGVVHYVEPCARWTWARATVASWAGLAVTIGAGAIALFAVLRPRVGLAPLTRLLVAMLATGFLLGQLSYATTGGFADLYDPADTARALGARGLHVVAWLVPLVLFALAAFAGAKVITDSFRAHFAPRSRLRAAGLMAAVIGAAGVLYFVAFEIEWRIRADIAMRGVAFEAARIAEVRHEAPPFPIGRVLFAIAVAAFGWALARPVRPVAADAESRIPRRHAYFVAGAALACFLGITLLVRWH
jgi:hypothetical protein